MTQLYFTGTQANVIAANAQINTNCGFPDANTETWDIPAASYSNPALWFITMPPVNGYKNQVGSWTQAQMIDQVVNVDIAPYDPNWFPPSPI